MSETPPLDDTLGALFVGLLISVWLYGLYCLQCYQYFQTYPKDRKLLKALVVVVWILNTTHVFINGQAMYSYLIENFSNLGVLQTSEWGITVNGLWDCSIAWVVQAFFTFRVWKFSSHNFYLAAGTFSLATAQLGFGMYTTFQGFKHNDFSVLNSAYWMITASLANTLICDLLITGSLLYYLNRNRTGFKSLDSIIKRLMWYSLSTGLLTSIFALASMVTFITMSHNLINVGISFFLGRLYANSLMTTLNGRAETRAKFSNNHEPIQLSDIPQEASVVILSVQDSVDHDGATQTSILTPNSLLDGQHPQDFA